eukprot:6202833-Prymnesium_polylepis.1
MEERGRSARKRDVPCATTARPPPASRVALTISITTPTFGAREPATRENSGRPREREALGSLRWPKTAGSPDALAPARSCSNMCT